MKKDVIKYEKILNESTSLFNELDSLLDKINKNQLKFKQLKEYYGSEEYFKDFDISNTTDKYNDIEHGILSEDLPFDLIGKSYEVSIKMIDTASNILKDH